MPFSFIDIEKEKNRVISFVFPFLLVIYFTTAYLLLLVFENAFSLEIISDGREGYALFFPPLTHVMLVFFFAFLAAFAHWSFSTANIIKRITSAIGAVPADAEDVYHHTFINIIDEVSVATGGRKLEPWVIRSSSKNAFALEDYEGRAVIGVTEGLLAALNRAQIEAVVGHEAGHIASGDCLDTTIIVALSEIYEEGFSGIKRALRRSRGRGFILVFLVFVVLGIMRCLSMLLHCFISRQRETRADAISVRLTRDPVSLAEALKLISRNWRGEGISGENLQSIFIVNPRHSQMDEEEGIIPDFFSTHPPVRSRINMLLGMAHMDERTLEENLKNFVRISPVSSPQVVAEDEPEPAANKWQVLKDGVWHGPFTLEEISGLEWLSPTHWVKIEGASSVLPACEYEKLAYIFSKRSGSSNEEPHCPNCRVALQEVLYEGAPILKCNYCQGVFVENQKISRILIRRDCVPSEKIERMTKLVLEKEYEILAKEIDLKSSWVMDCPVCKSRMRRQFFLFSYPVEVECCVSCSGLWFDKNELELLQCIYQHKAQ